MMNRMSDSGILFDQWREVLSAIQEADSASLFSHTSPDGDTLGSALSLLHWMRSMGKKVQLYTDGLMPKNCALLPGIEEVHFSATDAEICPLAIAVDISSPDRLGALQDAYEKAPLKLVIDHHGTNPGFGDFNYVDGDAPATAILMGRLMRHAGHTPTREEAICLYTALSTDTGNFIYQSTNAEAFTLMAELMDAGLPLAEHARHLFRRKSVPFVCLLREALPTLRIIENGQIAGITVSQEALQKAGANETHTDGIVDYAIDLEGVRLAYMLREQGPGQYKGSLRAQGMDGVDKVAAALGGGGHAQAAGFSFTGTLKEAVQATENALRNLLKEQG